VIAWAGLNLDSDVTQPRNPDKPRFVAGGRFRLVRNQRNDGGAMAGADAPNVEIGYAILAPGFETMLDLHGDPIKSVLMSSRRAPEADQVPRPVCYKPA
jgi:hypothetical protein